MNTSLRWGNPAGALSVQRCAPRPGAIGLKGLVGSGCSCRRFGLGQVASASLDCPLRHRALGGDLVVVPVAVTAEHGGHRVVPRALLWGLRIAPAVIVGVVFGVAR